MSRREFFASFGLLQTRDARPSRSDTRIALEGFKAMLSLSVTTQDFSGGLVDVLDRLVDSVDRLEGRAV